MLDSHPSIKALGEVFLYSHARVPLRRTAGHEVNQSYGNYADQSVRRRIMHLVNRAAIVEEYLDHLFAETDSQAIGFKLMRNQARQFPAVVRYILRHNLRVIHVIRLNVLKTYISRQTARRRKLYHAEGSVPVRKIEIPTNGLIDTLDRIANENCEWAGMLAGIPYTKVTYEAFVRDRDGELNRLYSFLDVEPNHNVSSNLVKINPDDIRNIVDNYQAVHHALTGTKYEWCLTG